MSSCANGLAVLKTDALHFAVVEPIVAGPQKVVDYINEMRFLNDPVLPGDFLLFNRFDKIMKIEEDLAVELFYLCGDLALPKNEVVEFVRFDGIDTPYPDWFGEMIEDSIFTHEFESFLYYSETGEYAVAIGDIFLYRDGAVRFMHSWEFTEMFYEVI